MLTEMQFFHPILYQATWSHFCFCDHLKTELLRMADIFWHFCDSFAI